MFINRVLNARVCINTISLETTIVGVVYNIPDVSNSIVVVGAHFILSRNSVATPLQSELQYSHCTPSSV